MKKGFTLVELLAVIVIMGILMIIGVNGYQKISLKIKEQNYKSKIAYIESQAALYASETGIFSTTVGKLVVEGYVEADNNKGEVINPIDKSVLNDRIVTITKEGEEYYAKVTDVTDKDVDVTNENLEIKAYVTSGETEIELKKDEWTKEDVTLVASIKKNIDTSTIEKIRWTSSAGTEEGTYESKKSLKITGISQILDTNYKAEIIFKDGTKYEATAKVKIDKQKPQVYEKETKIENENIWTNSEKLVTILGTDKGGSGIVGFYIDGLGDEYYKEPESNSKEKYDIRLGAGVHHVWAKDKVGNVSDPIEIEVDKIDMIPPSCNVLISGKDNNGNLVDPYGRDENGNKTGWFTAPILILTADGKDEENGSGLRSIEIGTNSEPSDGWSLDGKTITLKDDTSNFEVKAIVRDNAGNESVCFPKVDDGDDDGGVIRKDSKKPICNHTEDFDFWTNEGREIFYGCKDDGSGCVKDEENRFTIDYTLNKYKIPTYIIRDKAGNVRICPDTDDDNGGGDEITVLVDKEKPTCTINASGTQGENDWYIGDISLELTGEDKGNPDDVNNPNNVYNQSGINEDKKTLSRSSITEDTSGVTVTGSVTDQAGNEGTCSLTVKKDATEPECSITASGTKGNGDWYISETVEFEVSKTIEDGPSGISVTQIPNKLSKNDNTKDSGVTVYGFVKTGAGKTGKCNLNVKKDSLKPTCGNWSGEMLDETPTWRNGTLEVSVGCSDANSGCVSNTGKITYGTESVEIAETDITITIVDNAGNTKECKSGKFKLYYDNIPPSVTPSAVSNEGYFNKAGGAQADPTCYEFTSEQQMGDNKYPIGSKLCGSDSAQRSVMDKFIEEQSFYFGDQYRWRVPINWSAKFTSSDSGSGLGGYYWGTNSNPNKNKFLDGAGEQTILRGFVPGIEPYKNYDINNIKYNGGTYYYIVRDNANNKTMFEIGDMKFGYGDMTAQNWNIEDEKINSLNYVLLFASSNDSTVNSTITAGNKKDGAVINKNLLGSDGIVYSNYKSKDNKGELHTADVFNVNQSGSGDGDGTRKSVYATWAIWEYEDGFAPTYGFEHSR